MKVAVIDTGIDYIHDDPVDNPYVVDPEFLSNYKGGYDFFNNDDDPMDDNGHGTHVAGIIAAEHNGYLVTGVAPGVDLYALKILNESGEGEYSGLIAALGWAVDHDMDVVNMSLGAHEPSGRPPGRGRGRVQRRRDDGGRERQHQPRQLAGDLLRLSRSSSRPPTTRSSRSRSPARTTG